MPFFSKKYYSYINFICANSDIEEQELKAENNLIGGRERFWTDIENTSLVVSKRRISYLWLDCENSLYSK